MMTFDKIVEPALVRAAADSDLLSFTAAALWRGTLNETARREF